jgi:hypothetical protein
MTAAEFDAILSARLEKTRSVLASKAGEYASDKDRLHNFKSAAGLEGDTPADALRGMLRKHWVSIMDLCEAFAIRGSVPVAKIDEKVGDAINYLCLLEAVLLEHKENWK